MSEREIRVQESAPDTSRRVKNAPTAPHIPVPFSYFPSDDGTDENLLILLHGLGDTHTPFFKLGRQLKLPQTAVLALRAPEKIPYLYEESYQWYNSFDQLGEMIDRPNPSPALDLLTKVMKHLVDDCSWPPYRVHFFGFAQGGSVAAEFGLAWWKEHLLAQQREAGNANATTGTNVLGGTLGSIVSISGPLLSYPTLSKKSPTPVLVLHNPEAETALPPGAIDAYKKGYEHVATKTISDPGMPSSKASWEPIMEFWSRHLGRRKVEGLYEVMSGNA
ncbi:putative phospholipase Carboxylesterase [Lyophyllum shimeji]|uniref:Phospholipase Carboxylesterase n=1 Tax=Lyophyllum shimeji TaxID=47721 RepID=A0A9P3PZW8_LYOSH|nr:putative phospholipase Carboxylesterase [Lyophyllum shimeji]